MLTLSKAFFLAGIFFIPFYLWSSGLPQISHLFLLMSFATYFIAQRTVRFDSINLLLMAFICYIFIINSFYFIEHYDFEFLVSSFQLLFNFIIFYLVSRYLIDDRFIFKRFLIIYSFSSMIQLVVYFIGAGNIEFYPRYSGTFNDPNQMAYWCLTSLVVIVLLKSFLALSNKSFVALLFVYSFLLYITLSRSALLSLFFVALILIAEIIIKNPSRFVLIFLLLIIFFLLNDVGEFYKALAFDLTIAERLNVDLVSQADERGYSRFKDYPEYLLFGSGQGYHERFNMNKDFDYRSIEMHSTWAGLLHYYGVVGCFLFLIFLGAIFSRLSLQEKLLLCSTFIYGFFTYSLRSPNFWIILAVFYSYSKIKDGLKN